MSVTLEGAHFHAFHGEMEVERELGQVFNVNVKLTYEAEPSNMGQEKVTAASYADLYEKTKRVIMGTRFMSVEALAYRIGCDVLKITATSKQAIVEIKRQQLFIPGHMDAVDVCVTVDKSDAV